MNCKICDQAENNQTFQVREMMFGLRDEFTYMECSRCGCVQLMDPPEDQSMYYPSNYYSLSQTPLTIFTHLLGNSVKGWRYSYAVTGRGLLGRLVYGRAPDPVAQTLIPVGLNKSSRVLDVGCGNGVLLYALRNAGFRNILGVDPYINASITYPNGLHILKQPVDEVKGEWDLVMMHHAFEHVPDPRQTLMAIARLLSAEGVCLIRIPIASSYAWHHYRENWVQLDAPRHFFLHTLESMRLLAVEAGLRLANVIYDSTAIQFWGSEQYMRDIPLESEQSHWGNYAHSVFTPAEIAAFEAKARELNAAGQGDQACFYLKK